MNFHEMPLSWYVAKLETGEPFVSVLYGDGEINVATGDWTGGRHTPFNEDVTQQLADEMRASLTVDDPTILRGTDPFVARPETYHGRDVGFFDSLKQKLLSLGAGGDWYDGVVWDRASREGTLGSLIKALRGRTTALVGNQQLLTAVRGHLHCNRYFYVPKTNAAPLLMERGSSIPAFCPDADVFLLCCGLAAVPLALRIHKIRPTAAVLDLGSCLDVFAGIGAQRGWRGELYADPAAHQALIAKHLEGLD